MSIVELREQQAADYVAEAVRLHDAGALTEAVAAVRRGVLLYAAAGAETEPAQRRARADACQICGDYLTEAQEYPEAANIYQEATDLYAQVGTEEAERNARECARKILQNVEALRARPYERLYLLIAHYERQQHQLALESGTEARQAELCMQMARVFQRRERPREAVARFEEALELFARAPQTETVRMNCAECRHGIAGLLNYDLNDLPAAAQHYREAIALYTEVEPEVYGVQLARTLCVDALRAITRRLRAQGREPFSE